MRQLPAWIGLGAVLVMGLSACSGASHSPDSSVGASGSEAELQDPFDEFVLSSEQEAVVDRAVDALIGECMSEQGFTYSTTAPEVQEEPTYDPIWGPLDAESAALYGYEESAFSSAVVIDDSPSIDDPGYGVALMGSEAENGCAPKAYEELISAVPTTLTDAQWDQYGQIKADAATEAYEDQRTLDLEAEWSACMAAKGYDYSNPGEAMSDAWDAEPSQHEKDTASADVACKQELSFITQWNAILFSHEAEVISENQALMEKVKQNDLDRLAAAQRIIEEH